MKKAGILFGILVLLFCIGFISAAYSPLEIINIKQAGTGDPAISEHNRIFRAYPGIEYNIRAAVIGGLYPFYYSLNNSPSGMTIDKHTGEIKWTPTSEGVVNNIRLIVRDSEGTVVNATWSINVTKNGFLFVNSTYSGASIGTINQPYKSILDILDYGLTNDIIYFRSGTYNLPLYHSDSSEWLNQGCSLDYNGGRPNKWIAYPGEIVNIDMNKHYLEADGPGENDMWIDGFKFYNFLNGGFFGHCSANYVMFRNNDFSDLVVDLDGNQNSGFLYFTGFESSGYYKTIIDNDFHNFNSAQAVGSIYHSQKTLIADNDFYDAKYTRNNMIRAAIAIKRVLGYTTIRHNTFKNFSSENHVFGYSVNSGLRYSNYTEVSFNLFYHPGSDVFPQLNSAENNQNMYFYRNTIVGGINIDYLDFETHKPCGPYIFEDNLIQNSVGGIRYEYGDGDIRAIEIDNLKGTFGLVDSFGNLTSAYSSYLGKVGWQIVYEDDATSGPQIISVPQNLSHGQSITISGSGFGTKATAAPLVWDTFEDGSVNTIGTIGNWQQIGYGGSAFSGVSSSNGRLNSNYSALANFESYSYASFQGLNSVLSRDWFCQYWVRLDNDWIWGKGGSGTSDEFLSNIKLFRLWNPGNENENFAIALNNFNEATVAMTEGIESVPHYANMNYNDLTKQTWHLLQFEYRDSSTSNVADGSFKMWLDSKQVLSYSGFVGRTNNNLKRPFLIGFFNSWGYGTAHLLIDDVYSDSSLARIEIGDNQNYSLCTHREIQVPTSWNTNSITFTVNHGSFANGTTAYLFVVDANGTASVGKNITIGSGQTQPPTINVTTMQKLLNSFGSFKTGGFLSDYISQIKRFIF
jgi:hypothetical protein